MPDEILQCSRSWWAVRHTLSIDRST